MQKILSMSINSFSCRNIIEQMFEKVNRKYYEDLCVKRECFGSDGERFLGKMNGYLKRYVVKFIL